MRIKILALGLACLFFLGTMGLYSKYGQIDEVLLKGTIEAAESLVSPPHDVRISFNKDTKEIYVKFKTPSSYKINYADFWGRWRDNQWIVLQEFKRSKISVSKITVETNYRDMSAQVKFIHLANHVDKYAKSSTDDLWLKTASVYQKSKKSNLWEKLHL